jgi:hypothetical protein
MTESHAVEIPESLLLILASRGNMGDGKIPYTMQCWAEQECKRLGLTEKVLQEKARNYAEVKVRAKAILGTSTVDEVEKRVSAITNNFMAVEERMKANGK